MMNRSSTCIGSIMLLLIRIIALIYIHAIRSHGFVVLETSYNVHPLLLVMKSNRGTIIQRQTNCIDDDNHHCLLLTSGYHHNERRFLLFHQNQQQSTRWLYRTMKLSVSSRSGNDQKNSIKEFNNKGRNNKVIYVISSMLGGMTVGAIFRGGGNILSIQVPTMKDSIVFARAVLSVFGSVLLGLYMDNYIHIAFKWKSNNGSTTNINQATTTTLSSSSKFLVLPSWLSSSLSSWTILITLCVSAMIATVGIAPEPPYPLYDACWTYFLPSSLSFLLLSLKTVTNDNNNNNNVNLETTTTTAGKIDSIRSIDSRKSPIRTAVIRLAIPFVLASFGSFIGCYVSFYCFQNRLFSSSTIAAIASSCLLSSFIGGSVNFMATATAIVSSCSPRHDPTIANLLTAMSTADIIVMAIYFFILSTLLQFQPLQRKFGSSSPQQQLAIDLPSSTCTVAANETNIRSTDGTGTVTTQDLKIPSTSTTIPQSMLDCAITTQSSRWNRTVVSMALSTFVSFGIVWFARRMESFVTTVLTIPGTACGFIAFSAPIVANVILKVPSIQVRWNDIQKVSQILSNISFLLLFSCLGITADLYGTFLGNGLPCLIFSLSALLLHGVFMLSSSILYHTTIKFIVSKFGKSERDGSSVSAKCISKDPKWYSISLGDVLVASNAAIGGPATAAAFCGTMKPTMIVTKKSQETNNDDYDEDYESSIRTFLEWQKGLTVAATIWGVIGYAFGTTIGLSYYSFLRHKYNLL